MLVLISFHDFCGFFIALNGFLCVRMGSYKLFWDFLVFCRCMWVVEGLYGFLRVLKGCCGFLWVLVCFCGFLWVPIKFRTYNMCPTLHKFLSF